MILLPSEEETTPNWKYVLLNGANSCLLLLGYPSIQKGFGIKWTEQELIETIFLVEKGRKTYQGHLIPLLHEARTKALSDQHTLWPAAYTQSDHFCACSSEKYQPFHPKISEMASSNFEFGHVHLLQIGTLVRKQKSEWQTV